MVICHHKFTFPVLIGRNLVSYGMTDNFTALRSNVADVRINILPVAINPTLRTGFGGEEVGLCPCTIRDRFRNLVGAENSYGFKCFSHG